LLEEAEMALEIVKVEFKEACEFVAAHHRHHKPPIGHKFSIGVADDGVLVGVAIVGRPVSRILAADPVLTLEVTRSATDGTRNANSKLYGRCAQLAFGLGYDRIITYTQEGESGSSLRAAGYQVIAQRPPRRGWHTASRPRDDHGNDGIARTLWAATA
jgi:hypothetical protein